MQSWSEDLGLEGECRVHGWTSTAAWVGIVEGPGNDEQLPRRDLRQLPDLPLGDRSSSRCGRSLTSTTIFRGLRRHLRLSVDARTEEMEFMLKLGSVETLVAARRWQITGRPRTLGWARRQATRHPRHAGGIIQAAVGAACGARLARPWCSENFQVETVPTEKPMYRAQGRQGNRWRRTNSLVDEKSD